MLPRSAPKLAGTVGWGLFCASSWTWCIGMYLPVLMIRHFGWPGWLGFAIPNVVGCVALGYLVTRARSEELLREHAAATTLFSIVTLAYQVFFVAWIARAFVATSGAAAPSIPPEWLAAGTCALAALLLSACPTRWWPWLGAAASIVSLATWFDLGLAPLAELPATGDFTRLALLFTLPIVTFGFLLCPWLDRSLHRARQETPSVHAFAVFGVGFLLLILLTAAYTSEGVAILVGAVLVHLAVQATFTAAVHVREVRVSPWPRRPGLRQAALIGPILGGAIAAGLPLPPETIYLVFLGAYGLLFPAYILLFMFGGLGAWRRRGVAMMVFVAVVAGLAPLCAAGFLGGRTELLPIPVAALLVVWALTRPRRNARPAAG